MNKLKNSSQGFTLLELLVVVLIIGILAGVALPQYKFAVEKTRITKYLQIVRSVLEAQERHYMIHNQYAGPFYDLDVDITSLCKSSGGSRKNVLYNCMDGSIEIDNKMAYNKGRGIVSIIYCPSVKNITQTSYDICQDNREMEINFYCANTKYPNLTSCTGYTDKGKRFCNALKGKI